MPSMLDSLLGTTAKDLGLGQNLSDQVAGETDEEKKRKKLGLAQSPAVQSLFGYGQTGIAPMSLGLGKGAGRY
jgi:hypothetical protein